MLRKNLEVFSQQEIVYAKQKVPRQNINIRRVFKITSLGGKIANLNFNYSFKAAEAEEEFAVRYKEGEGGGGKK
jgi:putative hemolysin